MTTFHTYTFTPDQIGKLLDSVISTLGLSAGQTAAFAPDWTTKSSEIRRYDLIDKDKKVFSTLVVSEENGRLSIHTEKVEPRIISI